MLNKGCLSLLYAGLISEVDHYSVERNKRNKSDAGVGKLFTVQTLLERKLNFPVLWI